METNMYKEAVAYRKLGWSIFPVKKDKKPAVPTWKEYQHRHPTDKEVEQWWGAGSSNGIALVTGELSGIVVIDDDRPKYDITDGIKFPATVTSKTGSGGWHHFYNHPGHTISNSTGEVEKYVDVRGDGGYVILPPSENNVGKYTWSLSPEDDEFAEVPPVLLELLTKQVEGEVKARTTLPELVDLKDGEGRNNAMTSFVGKLLCATSPNKWEEEVWPAAQAVNETYEPPMSQNELQSIYSSICGIERNKRPSKEKEESLVYVPAMSHAELIAKVFPLARYTIEPFFEQGTMNMVSAPPNTWKSWLLFQFAYNIASGIEVLGKFATEKAGVMIVNEEDSARLVQDRLRLLAITEPDLPIYYRIAQGAKLTEDFIKPLIAEAKEMDVGVIMFDSLRAIHSADENDSTEMQEVLDLLKQISRENITVIFTHHHRKKAQFGGKNNDAESTRGSSGINAAISGHISLEEKDNKPDDSKYIIVRHLKSKVGEKLAPFDVGIETSENSVSFHYIGEHEEQNQAENEAKEAIIAALEGRDELLSRKDFLHLNVAGKTTIKKATIALVAEGNIRALKRKEAEQMGLKSLTEGRANELLYSLKLEEVRVLENPVVEMAAQLDYDF